MKVGVQGKGLWRNSHGTYKSLPHNDEKPKGSQGRMKENERRGAGRKASTGDLLKADEWRGVGTREV